MIICPVCLQEPYKCSCDKKESMKLAAQNVQTIVVPNSGHWIQEEQPVRLVELLNNFFSGNSATTTSK